MTKPTKDELVALVAYCLDSKDEEKVDAGLRLLDPVIIKAGHDPYEIVSAAYSQGA